MARITKAERKIMTQIDDLIYGTDRPLTFDEKYFVLENFNPAFYTDNSYLGAFFTPIEFVRDFYVTEIGNTRKVIDLCAGIGGLTFFSANNCIREERAKQITCVEYNSRHVEIGKRILPEADWICGDALTYNDDYRYDLVVSNPPFGKIKTGDNENSGLLYTGSEFEFKIIECGAKFADQGAFIAIASSFPWRYDKRGCYEPLDSVSKYNKFHNDTGIILHCSGNIDCSIYDNEWIGTKVSTDVCFVDYTEGYKGYSKPEPVVKSDDPFGFLE